MWVSTISPRTKCGYRGELRRAGTAAAWRAVDVTTKNGNGRHLLDVTFYRLEICLELLLPVLELAAVGLAVHPVELGSLDRALNRLVPELLLRLDQLRQQLVSVVLERLWAGRTRARNLKRPPARIPCAESAPPHLVTAREARAARR